MNIENQNIEFKETWRDEYIKTLVAFANAKGGKMIIGKDDDGIAVGINNAKELLEILPNKVAQRIGIFPDVNLVIENNIELIEISVLHYRVPISLNGKYYIRKGSTTQELTDKDLNRFLLERNNETWENIVEEDAGLYKIDNDTVERFKRLAKDNIKGIESESTETILKKLRLMDANNKLKRAAILLFGKDPQSYFLSSYFKIGKFSSPSELISDNIVEGNLFKQLDDVMDLLNTKYLTRKVTGYENWQRKEELEYPAIALREAVINALIHKDYSGSHIQMKIFPDSIWLWNSGGLMEGLTVDMLKRNHESVLRNELICNVFYKAGFIESWGRGTIKILDACKSYAIPEPVFNATEYNFTIEFKKDRFTEEFFKSLNLNERQIKLINELKEKGKINNSEYKKLFGKITDRTVLRDLNELIDKKVIIKHGETKGVYYTLRMSE